MKSPRLIFVLFVFFVANGLAQQLISDLVVQRTEVFSGDLTPTQIAADQDNYNPTSPPVRATSPTLVTPALGVATATTLNGIQVDQGANSNIGNTALGDEVLLNVLPYSGTDGGYNTGVGSHALSSLTTASDCTAVGANTLTSLTTGYYNTAIGHYAGRRTTTGPANTALGAFSLHENVSGTHNTAVGFEAGYGSQATPPTGIRNYFGGYQAAYNYTAADETVAIGYQAAVALSSGDSNTAIGALSLYTMTTGNNNVGLGYGAGDGITTGTGNTVIGANTTGLAAGLSNNIILGSGAGIMAQHDGTDWTFTGRIKSASTGGVLEGLTASTAAKYLRIQSTGGDVYLGTEQNGGGFFTGAASYETVLYSPTNNVYIRTPALSTNGSITTALAFIGGVQALSGTGAVNVTAAHTDFTSTGGAQALTLADGTLGQTKTIVHVVDGGSGVLTPTTKIGFTTITFTAVGDSVTLRYSSAGWAIVGIFGAVAA